MKMEMPFAVWPKIILVLLIVLGVGVLLFGFGLSKLFSNRDTRKFGKILLLLPLMVVGALLMSYLVLIPVRFVQDNAHSAIEVHQGSHVDVSEGGDVIVRTAPPVAARKPAPALPSPAQAASDSSGVAKTFAAVQKAFVTALRSMQQPSKPPAPAAEKSAAAAPVAAKRPAWIDNPPQPSADVYEVAVKAGPWKTRVECEESLDEEIAWAVDSYVAWRIGEEARAEVVLPADYARQHLVKEQWLEKVNTSLGEMHNLHALLCFDRQVEGKLQDAWKETLLGARVILAAAILGGALLLLSVIYGYLKIDLATAGAYRGRLRFVATAVVVTLAAAGAALCRLGGAVRNV